MWSIVGFLCFFGTFLFFGTAIYGLFTKDADKYSISKLSLVISGICLVIFLFSPFRSTGLGIIFGSEKPTKEVVSNESNVKNDTEGTLVTKLENITSNGGLGDTLNVLIEEYGDFKDEAGRISFRNGYIYTDTPFNNSGDSFVWNITVNFEVTDNPARSREEAIEISKALLPQDSVLIREREEVLNEDYTTDIIEYKSNLLADRINDKNLYGDAEIGTFAVHLNKYTGNDFEKGYFQVGITTGNPRP